MYRARFRSSHSFIHGKGTGLFNNSPHRLFLDIQNSTSYSSQATQSQTFHQTNSPLKPRLESHFKNNLFSEISILLLENQVRNCLLEEKEVKERDTSYPAAATTTNTAETYLDNVEKEIRDFRRNYITSSTASSSNVFDAFLNELPTSPNSAPSPQTRWIHPSLCSNSPKHTASSKTLANQPQQRQRRNLPNPIDYTSIPSTLLHAKPYTPPPPPFSPLPSRMPSLHSISLSITTDEAIGNKPVLLSAIMALQCVSGKRADPVFATKGDASKKIRAGMPIGAKASARPTR